MDWGDKRDREEGIKGIEWEQYFKKLYSLNKIEKKHETITQSTNPNNEINKPFSIEELKKVIKNLKNKKASGYDRIPNEFLKHAPEEILRLMLKLFYLILKTGVAPKNWCIGIINPTIKKVREMNQTTIVGYA